MTDKLTSNIFVVFCLLVILTMFAVAFNKAMALPTVYFSWSTGECTAVDNYTDTEYTCEKLPKRYYHTYVE